MMRLCWVWKRWSGDERSVIVLLDCIGSQEAFRQPFSLRVESLGYILVDFAVFSITSPI